MPLASKRRIVALLALSLALLLSACGQAIAKPHATATPARAPTATPFPTQPPAPTVAVIQASGQPVWGKTAYWSHASLPAGFGMQFHVSDLQVAPSDGRTAYACAIPGDQTQPGHPRVIVTHNGGASWSDVSSIPVSWLSCVSLAIDLLDPSVVIAAGDFGGGVQEITFDGGGSWQALSLPPQQSILQFATRGDHAYALVIVPQTGGNGAATILAESADHLRTWREIDGSLAAQNLRQFWINPGSGALMLQTYGTGLWTSDDDGATWTQMPIPTISEYDYMVQQPRANQPWRLCTVSLYCTVDGGASWFKPPQVTFWQLAGIASDGALLVYDEGYMIYRLPLGATQWQKLGATPHAGCCIRYVASSNGSMLWKFPAESDGAAISDKPNDVYFAAYPY